MMDDANVKRLREEVIKPVLLGLVKEKRLHINEVEDVEQIVFIKLLGKVAKGANPNTFTKALVSKIARNCAVDYFDDKLAAQGRPRTAARLHVKSPEKLLSIGQAGTSFYQEFSIAATGDDDARSKEINIRLKSDGAMRITSGNKTHLPSEVAMFNEALDETEQKSFLRLSPLKPEDVIIVRLREEKSYTFPEIGAKLNLTPQTARQRYHRAKKRINEAG